MNQKIVIKTFDGKVIFKGNIIDIPIKEEAIINKSIELFNDDDPCIIHRSFVIKTIVDNFLKTIETNKKVSLAPYKNILSYLDINNLEQMILIFEG